MTIFFCTSLFANEIPEEYYDIKDSKKMKKTFFSYILVLSKKQNALILQDREFIKNTYNFINTLDVNSTKYKRFKTIAKRYKLKRDYSLKTYLTKIDIIPNSLVLAQAAVESGWGKSRFFTKANNIFGQWTWSGVGLTPLSRDAGKKHKIKIFSSLEESVKGYMINLNVGWGYKDFRAVRYELREEKNVLKGTDLTHTLVNYSQKKEVYTKLLKNIIISNKLSIHD
jgi:Bax protein